MTEWLTENAGRAYPLEREWPEALSERWTRVLLDACVGYDGLPADGRIILLKVIRLGGSAVFRIGVSASSYVDVKATPGDGARTVAYAHGPRYRAFVVVGNQALASAIAGTPVGWEGDVGVPLALRCSSWANRRVESIEAHSPADPCAGLVFGPGTEHVVAAMSGDVTLAAKNGIDLDVTTMAPLDGDVLRVTPVVAPLSARSADRPVDMMIRGDDCISVEALPGYGVAGGVVYRLSDPSSGGVIRLTGKCKPCCQCEDYRDAAEALRPGHRATFSVQSLLELARGEYESAVAEFEKVKSLASDRVNGYGNVPVSAVAVASGGVTPLVLARGTRCRIAVNITVVNMALERVRISEVEVNVPGGYSFLKAHWSTSGSSARSGSSIANATWTLEPGDALTVVTTHVATSSTNTAGKPQGMSVTMTRKLRSRDEDRTPFGVK